MTLKKTLFASLYSSTALLTSFFALTEKSYAQNTTVADPASMLGPRATARGGATVASDLAHDALFQNPAATAFAQRYAVNFAYLGKGDALAASVVDTKSGPVGGGLYYLRRDIKGQTAKNPGLGNFERLEERAGGALMTRLGALGLGANVKWSYRRTKDPRINNTSAWNFDVGARYVVNPEFSIGLLGQNLLEDEHGLNAKVLSFGAEYKALPYLAFSGQISKVSEPDTILQMSLPKADGGITWAVGSEFQWGEAFVIQAGYNNNEVWDDSYAGFGLGYRAVNFAIDYSLQAGVSGNNSTVHSVGISALL